MHPGVDVIQGDIKKARFRHLRGTVALVAGGPPCQPFSSGGKRLASLDPRDGFPAFLRALGEIRPDAVLIENVAGLIGASRRGYFVALVTSLERQGFSVTWRVLHAAGYGVPQKRRRLFSVGTRRDPFEFPEPTHGPGLNRPWVRAGSVVSPDRTLGEPNPSIVTYARRPDLRPSPYDGHLFNGGGRPINPDAPAPTILASAGGNKTPFLDVARVVPTYHAELLRGGKPRCGRVSGARRITVSEAALLQTFPECIEFMGPRSTQYTLVGNAVPPALAKAVGLPLSLHLAAWTEADRQAA